MKHLNEMTDEELVDELCVAAFGEETIGPYIPPDDCAPLKEEILRRMALRDRDN